jgi:integrase
MRGKRSPEKRGHGEGGLFQITGSTKWYTKINGKRQSTGTSVFADALEVLNQRKGRVALNIPDPVAGAKITYEQMREGLLSHRRNHNARSLFKRADGTENICGLNHLDAFFQDKLANDITTRSLQGFVEYRKRAGANVATINRNLGLLRRMFHLAAPDNPLLKIPNFAAVHFKEEHVRQGFLDAVQFNKLLAALPARLRPFILLLYTTGVRTGEARKIQWSQVDFAEGVIRLSGKQTKNANARVLPLDDELAEMLKAERKTSGLVFTFVSFRKAWCNACVKVGLGTLDRIGENKKVNGGHGLYEGLIPHDLRRSAIRDLIRAGVSQTVAMRISGHKTDAVFRRYNITEDKDLLAAKDSLRAYRAMASASAAVEEIQDRSRIGQVQELVLTEP